MSFQLVSKSVTSDELECCNGLYIALLHWRHHIWKLRRSGCS